LLKDVSNIELTEALEQSQYAQAQRVDVFNSEVTKALILIKEGGENGKGPAALKAAITKAKANGTFTEFEKAKE
jgi:hypothetical protein